MDENQQYCNCGGQLRYYHGDEMSCNKYSVCPTYQNLEKLAYERLQLLDAYRAKRKVDGFFNRVFDAQNHFAAECRIKELEKEYPSEKVSEEESNYTVKFHSGHGFSGTVNVQAKSSEEAREMVMKRCGALSAIVIE